MENSWQNLKSKPFGILAPMEDVTDSVFRRVILKASGDGVGQQLSVLFTEFTNCDGICSIGQAKVIHRLHYTKSEQAQTPIIAQIWGSTVQNYYETAKLCLELGFDGIDINMGCPEKSVIKQGACSALINNHELAKQIVEVVIKGVEGKIPVSVKTRIGFAKIETKEWISFLASLPIQTLIVHGRTVAELSNVPCHYKELEIACKIAKQINPQLVFVANGDILDYRQGESLCRRFSFDGYMIGRGVFKNPWCFNPSVRVSVAQDGHTILPEVTKQDRIELLKYHLDLWQETWKAPNATKHYPSLKKYYKIYLQNFEGALEFRKLMMDTKTIEEATSLVNTISL
jgi:tRNA-dihydrouridine synthase